MSYRRNSFKGVAKITSLWLPGYPQIGVLEAVSRALDAADENPREIIRPAVRIDQGVTYGSANGVRLEDACQPCVDSGYVACRTSDEPRYQENTKVGGISDPMPADTWSDRLMSFDKETWTSYLQATNLPYFYFNDICGRHDYTNMAHIGPNTLTGVTYDTY